MDDPRWAAAFIVALLAASVAAIIAMAVITFKGA